MDRRLVVITGGAGFLGEHLTRAFVEAGDQVRLFDAAGRPEWSAALGVEHMQGDVRDIEAVTRATAGATVIVHAAFASPRQPVDVIEEANIRGTTHVRDAAIRNTVPRVLLVSSTVVTGPPRRHPIWSASPLSRLDLYRTSRIEAERILSDGSARHFTSAIVRPQSFLGPGRLGAFGIIFELIRTGDPVPVLGDGSHRYQLLAVQDLAQGIRLLSTSTSQGVFAFGAREFSTVREDLQALLARVQSRSRLRFFPAGLSRAGLRSLELAGFVPLSEWHRHSAWRRDSVADCSRAERELGWAARLSNVDAMAEAYHWYADVIRARGAATRTHPLPWAHTALRRIIRMLPGS
jgi:nucleoside-diphosphate-sugar epimerase